MERGGRSSEGRTQGVKVYAEEVDGSTGVVSARGGARVVVGQGILFNKTKDKEEKLRRRGRREELLVVLP